ncbi:DUF4244 domain-containing protein [Isoptericola sp. 4D.3]|uniref:DUF4244 domain-containing protein n=1 Tax=Isoptericola peretonis TaxID=2918523 RepID=A0ABT0J0D5_9MICO|nr:DUF4244 domain-containing protein [Isoptericola sp. 4D.3]
MRNDDEGREPDDTPTGPGAERQDPAEQGSARPDPEAGLATAEYAVATVAAVGFAGLLIAVLKSGTVKGLLEGIISSALSI